MTEPILEPRSWLALCMCAHAHTHTHTEEKNMCQELCWKLRKQIDSLWPKLRGECREIRSQDPVKAVEGIIGRSKGERQLIWT